MRELEYSCEWNKSSFEPITRDITTTFKNSQYMNTNVNILKEIYNKSNCEVKLIMEKEFPTLFLTKTLLQQAIECLSETDEEVIKLRKLEPILEYGCNILSEQKLIVIIKFKNQSWTPNWQDENEPKYFIWWDLKNNCFSRVFGYSHYAVISSRLCFKSESITNELLELEEFQLLLKRYFNK